MENKPTFFSANTPFGLVTGIGFIAASYACYKTTGMLNMDPRLNNVILLLIIAGAFIGVRRYREKVLNGFISYSQALGTSVYIIAVGTIVYGIFLYIMYQQFPELQENYLSNIITVLDEVYKGNPMLDTMKNMMQAMVSPIFISLTEIFNKLFTAVMFSLLLAGLLKRKRPLSSPPTQ